MRPPRRLPSVDVVDAADAAAAVLSAGNLVENGGFETAAVPLDGAEQLPPAHIVRSAVPHGLSGLFLKAHGFPSVFCSSDHIFCSEQGSTRIRPRGHGIPSHNTHKRAGDGAASSVRFRSVRSRRTARRTRDCRQPYDTPWPRGNLGIGWVQNPGARVRTQCRGGRRGPTHTGGARHEFPKYRKRGREAPGTGSGP